MSAKVINITPLAAVVAIGALAACSSDLTGGNRHPVQVSFISNSPSAPATGIRMSPDVTVGATGDLILTKVQVVLDKIELDRNGTSSCVAEVE